VERKPMMPRRFSIHSGRRSFPGDYSPRSEYPEIEAVKLFAKVGAYVSQPERLL
jgi:hypothetical protein